MRIPLFHVDAFVTSGVFTGNPAAVCPLTAWLPDALLQGIAAENNLSETAFLVGGGGGYDIRWMTPAAEVDLCGHATLAAGHVVFTALEPSRQTVRFGSKSGPLEVSRTGDVLALDFPARPPRRVADSDVLARALGRAPRELWESRDSFAVFDHEDEVRALAPDMALLRGFSREVIVTAPGEGCDFVSRYFAPRLGVPEDPVTGSAHCTLIPYWASRLSRTSLHARQVSARGGELQCELRGDRVSIGGRAVSYLQGLIEI